MQEEALHIELPSRSSGRIGAQKPRAKLTFHFAESTGSLSVACDVAKLLQKKTAEGSLVCEDVAGLKTEIAAAEIAAARARALRLVEMRDRCAHEITEKLATDGYSKSCISAVVEWLCALRIVDDAHFAEIFVRSKCHAGWGRARIERELRARDIEPSALTGWPEDFFEDDDELERAYSIASRRPMPRLRAFEKTVRFLLGRGFSMSVATQAARRVLDEREEHAIAEF
ncbi:MAG: regulatory protein RecX [Atopobiaceae bacterium]|nr:regulatory protein RecX [Atopobiaceae bacterium]